MVHLYSTIYKQISYTNKRFTLVNKTIYRGEQAKRAAQEKAEAQAAQQAAMQEIEKESKQKTEAEPPAVAQINFGAYGQRAVSFLARNFYNLKYVALVLAFCINFMLLFYKVIQLKLNLKKCNGVNKLLENKSLNCLVASVIIGICYLKKCLCINTKQKN